MFAEEVRRQLEGVSSLTWVMGGDQSQDIRLGGQCLPLLGHLAGPPLVLLCFVCSQDGVSQCSLTYSVDLAGLELNAEPACIPSAGIKPSPQFSF